MNKSVDFIKGNKFSAVTLRVNTKKVNKYDIRKFFNLEFREFRGINNNMPFFEKDKKSDGFHIFWLTEVETAMLYNILETLVRKILVSKEELEAIFEDIIIWKKDIIFEKWTMAFVGMNLIHTNSNNSNMGKESKTLNISFNFSKKNDKYSLKWLKLSSTQKNKKLETMLNKQDIFVLINFFSNAYR